MARRAKRSNAQKRSWRSPVLKAAACGALILMCLVFALVVGDSDYRASAVGWLPLIVVLVGIALAWGYLQLLRRGLRFVEKTDLGNCQRGEDVKFTIRFKNTTPLFFFRIEVYFFVSDLFGNTANESMTTLALAPFETYDMDFTVRFEHIGTYSAGLHRLVISDFLRLFTTTQENLKKHNVEVTPRLQPLRRIEFSNEAVLETLRAVKSALADSLDYAYVRNYVPGDPIKTIHWKLSARSEGYLTRLFEVYTNPGVAIVMDFYAPANKVSVLMSMFDAVVETAFSVGRYAQTQGMETEVHYCNKYDERVRRVSWRGEELADIINEIPRISNKSERQAVALGIMEALMRSQYSQNNLVVCTANLSAQMISTIIEAKAHQREALLFAVIPRNLVGREREDYCAALGRLDAAGVGYIILSKSEELLGVSR